VVHRGLQDMRGQSGGGETVIRKLTAEVQRFRSPRIDLPSLHSILLHPSVDTIALSRQASVEEQTMS
jgi:hypothetical protein